jgi:hypothetical protein
MRRLFLELAILFQGDRSGDECRAIQRAQKTISPNTLIMTVHTGLVIATTSVAKFTVLRGENIRRITGEIVLTSTLRAPHGHHQHSPGASNGVRAGKIEGRDKESSPVA